MIVSLAGGEVLQGAVAGSTYQVEDVTVTITLSRINHYLGTDLTVKEVNEIFEALGFGYQSEGKRSPLLFLLVAGISRLKRILLKKSLVSMVMIACLPHYQVERLLQEV